jgi:hypothetical protein
LVIGPPAIAPGSKLANLIGLQPETAEHSLAGERGLEDVGDWEMYKAMDWLLKRQNRIENKLAKKHLADGTLVLYDVSSSNYTGRQSALIKTGHRRDGKPGEPQIVYGLLCAPDGCPVAIEVFSGNTADPTTFTALRNDSIRKLVEQKTIPLSLFDERAFRSMKSVDLKVRPIYHWKDDRIRAHVFLCMLAYYVEWHMRGELAEVLFDDHEREAAEATRESIVSKAPRSKAAKQKERQRRTADGLAVQSFQCLLKDLATLSKNRVRWDSHAETEFDRLTEPTPLQQRVFQLLGLSPQLVDRTGNSPKSQKSRVFLALMPKNRLPEEKSSG